MVFCGRGIATGESIAASLGPRCIFVQANVTSEVDVKRVIDTAVQQFGQLHVLFNNAGGGTGLSSVEKATDEHIRNGFGLNFDSVVFGIKHAIPHLKKQATSSIINNSSIAAKKAGFGDAM